MDWKAALSRFRKVLDGHLRNQGFIYKGHNQWERPLDHWRGLFSFEIIPRNRGNSRLIYISITLIKSELLSPEAANSLGSLVLPSSVNYAVYRVTCPGPELHEKLATSPEELVAFGQETLRQLDDLWIPWMVSHSAERGESVEGASRHFELVDKSLAFVP